MHHRNLQTCVGACLAGMAAALPAQAADKIAILHTFTGGADGGYPRAGLVQDSSGAFYGATSGGGSLGGGVVFKLTPPATGTATWTETVLYNFDAGANGGLVFGTLLRSKTGVLYGVAAAFGNQNAGEVFRLLPPKPGKTEWVHQILYAFSGATDGYDPWGALVQDNSGAIYGTTTLGGANGLGTVFELTPSKTPGAPWTETILHDFAGGSDGRVPFAGLLLGPGGVLYGTSGGGGGGGGGGGQDYGVAFKMSRPAAGGSQWGFEVLHGFSGGADGAEPMGALIAGKDGALFGTTSGGPDGLGTVYQLNPPADGSHAWSETVLYTVRGAGQDGNGPQSGVTMDASGALYGTTLADGGSDLGEVYKLTPPAAGATKWTGSVIHKFTTLPSGVFPYASVFPGASGVLYGTTFGAQNQQTGKAYPGTVWSITQD